MLTSSGTCSSAAPCIASSVSSFGAVTLVGGDLEDDLVVHLEDQAASQALVLQRLVEPHDRDLEDVGGQALDAGVHGLALAGLADAVVGDDSSGIMAASAEQRLGVAPVAGLGDRAGHVRPDPGEGDEVGVEDLGRLVDGDVEPLRQPVRLHAVGEPVRDHLRLRALAQRHLVRRHAEDAGRGRGVDVLSGRERLDQAGVLREVGDHPQLDLVVVGDEQRHALGRDERPPEPPPLLGADRDVVQVGLVATTSRPVRATVWLKVAWMRPSSATSPSSDSP